MTFYRTTLLNNEHWNGLSAVDVQAIEPPPPALTRLVAPVASGLVLALLLAGSVAGAHRATTSDTPLAEVAVSSLDAPQVALPDLTPMPEDFAPSEFRQRVLDRQDAGEPLPDAGMIALQEGLQERQDLTSKYFQEILNRDAAIQSDRAQLATIAQQLGLPRDRFASPPPPPQEGVGALLPGDRAALTSAPAPAATRGAMVASFGDLAGLVSAYLDLPCPLWAGDWRCAQAVDHARSELARGHGLNLNRPDASPTLGTHVGQPFGPTAVDFEPVELFNGQPVHFHDGLDLDANYDEPVMAAASGTVVFAGVIPSGAQTVEIAHAGGLHTLYLHEEALLVQQGQQVQKGQIIGLVGASGMATGPHVHFQVNDSFGRAIDPMQFIR